NSVGEFGPVNPRGWQAARGIAYSLVWSDDGAQLIAAGRGGRVKCWSVSAAQNAGYFGFTVENANAFSLIPRTNSLLAIASTRRGLTRWDWSKGVVEEDVTGESYDDVRVSPDAKYVAVRSNGEQIQVFPLAEAFRRPLAETTVFTWKPGGAVRGLQFSPDSQSLAVPFQPAGTDNRP